AIFWQRYLAGLPGYEEQPLTYHNTLNNAPADRDSTAESPMWMVTTEPLLNELVMELQRLRQNLLDQPHTRQELEFSRLKVEESRAAFSRMIRQGEQKLHRLCELICDTFLNTYQMQSIVIG